jgi:DNA-binding transcriptional LysR family regulator
MDTLVGMRVFAKVVETESFAEAARRLKLSPAMVTKHIQRIEGRIGARLLNRSTRRLSLTEAGAEYHRRCISVLAAFDEAESLASDLGRLPRGRLRISAPDNFGPTVLWPIVSKFMQRYPDIQVDLVLTDRLVDLIDEEMDLAIRLLARPADSSLVARKLAVSTLVVCASPGYLRKAPPLRTPDDLAAHRCLVYGRGTKHDGWTFARGGRSQVVKVPVALQSNQIRMLCRAALDGAGIVMQPSFNLWPHLASGELTRVLGEWSAGALHVFAVFPSRSFLPAKTRLFIDFLTSHFPNDPDQDVWLARIRPRPRKSGRPTPRTIDAPSG